MTHIHVGRYEASRHEPTSGELFCAQVEDALGHDVDGDEELDGYSVGGVYDHFDLGHTVAETVAAIQRSKRVAARRIAKVVIHPYTPVQIANNAARIALDTPLLSSVLAKLNALPPVAGAMQAR